MSDLDSSHAPVAHVFSGTCPFPQQNSVRFTIPGPAKAKGRGRVHRVGNRVYVYPDQATVLYENWVKLHAVEAWKDRDLLDGPLDISIDVVYEPVPTTSKKNRAAMLAGVIRPTKFPDLDNIVKAVIDGCKTVIMRDDVQVVGILARKRYGSKFGVEVSISPALTTLDPNLERKF